MKLLIFEDIIRIVYTLEMHAELVMLYGKNNLIHSGNNLRINEINFATKWSILCLAVKKLGGYQFSKSLDRAKKISWMTWPFSRFHFVRSLFFGKNHCWMQAFISEILERFLMNTLYIHQHISLQLYQKFSTCYLIVIAQHFNSK